MKDTEELRAALKAALLKDPDAYQVIGSRTGLGKMKVELIAEGKVTPTTMERTKLEVMA
jgi:hypothetical protein